MCAKSTSLVCIKTFLIASNLFFVLTGLVLAGIACWMLIWPKGFLEIIGPLLLRISAYSILATGGLIVFLAFLGFTGTALENRCILVMFFTLLCGIFMGFLVVGTLVAVFREDLFTLIVNRMSFGVQHAYGVSSFWTQWLDFLQTRLQCCAVEDNGAALYTRSMWYSLRYRKQPTLDDEPINVLSDTIDNYPVNVPATCCIMTSQGTEYLNRTACQMSPPDVNRNQFLNPHGCIPVILTIFQKNATPILITILLIAFLLISALMLTLLLLRNLSIDEYAPVNWNERV